MTKHKHKPRTIGYFRHNFFIMILIILCVSYNITYENSTYKYNAISITKNGSISILHDYDAIIEFENKGRTVVYYNHNSCNFVAVFTENRKLHSNVMFTNIEHLWNDLYGMTNWWEEFNSNDKGIIDLKPYGQNMSINYQWVTFEDGTKYLLIYNTNNIQHRLFTTFRISWYLIIILSFIMLMDIVYWQSHGVTNAYKKINEDIIIRKLILFGSSFLFFLLLLTGLIHIATDSMP